MKRFSEAVPMALYRGNGVFAQNPAQRGDLYAQVAVFDHHAGPGAFNQHIFADHCTIGFDQAHEQIQRAASQRLRLARQQKLPFVGPKLKFTPLETRCHGN